MNRSAVDTIKGYYYQFDLTILELLKSKNGTDSVVIENIEDVDLQTASETTAVQCKYYSKTEYTHSVIAKPIKQMLFHYAKNTSPLEVNYHLYGHYKKGQEKLILPLTVDYLKKHFLTNKSDGKKVEYHKELKLNDKELEKFISKLSIDNKAESYDDQINSIITLLVKEFKCSQGEAEDYYYNNALRVVKDKSVAQDITSRTLTRGNFIKAINKKEDLFNVWYAGFLGRDKFLKKIRAEHFTEVNISPFDRFFLIGIEVAAYERNKINTVIQSISKKWSKLSQREKNKFCPYIFISGISKTEILEIKKELYQSGFLFLDGHPFLGSDFSVEQILIKPDEHNGIKVKIINNLKQIESVISRSTYTKEIYQFYFDKPFYSNANTNIKHVKIQVHNIDEIKKII